VAIASRWAREGFDGRLPHPPISRTSTFWLVEIGDGFAAFEGEPGDHLLNPMGTAHGGWAMTLIDRARPAAPATPDVGGSRL
jgi:acyl-coenzyme A thioesterase PaaI-like protein